MRDKILLINMPFAPLSSPSIGLTLLKETLRKNGIRCEILYFNLLFAKTIGQSLYSKISSGFPVNHDMLGEWIFSPSLFDNWQDNTDFIDEIVLGNNPSHHKTKYNRQKISADFIKKIMAIREKVLPFLATCLDRVLGKEAAVVGFTSVFQQQVSSLALAKRIKLTDAESRICFGGANNEGRMGLEVIRKFSFLDYVISGEGEHAFLFLVQKILAGEPCEDYKGILSRENNSNDKLTDGRIGVKQVTDLDALPYVDYDDYFRQLKQLNLAGKFTSRIPFETSRGCWWGMKNHCTFCGLNGENMTQRTKSSIRALDEFGILLKKYRGYPVSVVDNILDYNYFKDFIPALIDLRKKEEYNLFYEVKANLTKEQLSMMKDAGITVIQPGIESFCKGTLKIMRKGVSPIQNIQLLKWCKELNITVEWNMLYGFPNEHIEEYEAVSQLLPLLSHLDPPNSFGPIRLDRFSPNFNESDQLGFKNIRPYPTYRYIYPFDDSSLFNLAYYFTYEYKETHFEFERLKQFGQNIRKWKRGHMDSALFYSDNEDNLIIWDLRPIASTPIYVLSEISRIIYLSCDKGQRLGPCVQHIQESVSPNYISEEDIKKTLDFFIQHHLMLLYDDNYLSLAVNDANVKNSKNVADKIKQLVSIDDSGESPAVVLNKPFFIQ